MTHRMLRAGLAAAMVGAVLLGGGCRRRPQADLVVITPHNERILQEFQTAFSAWHREKFGSPVKIEWLNPGGTSACTQYLLKQYENSSSSGADVYFGGGAPDHTLLAGKGLCIPVDLPAETLAQLSETINGVRQQDPEHRWHAAAISCFGILYNRKLLADANLPVPRTWDDLAASGMYGQVAAADAQSGSARAAYELIIQSAPDWPAGWARLLKIFANCRKFTAGGTDVITSVADGDVMAGLAIDYYAYMQMAATGDRLGFTLVSGSTAFTPDPIALLKNPPHEPLARRFVEFVLSERGQGLFCLSPGARGGPVQFALYRQPARKDVYEKYAGKMLAPLVNPFVQSEPVAYDVEAADVRVGLLLGPLMKAAVLDSRQQLAKAWKAILDAGSPADLVAEFVALPPDLADAKTSLETAKKLAGFEQREAVTSAWQRHWRDKYNGILARIAH